jgi:DNA-binding GntR family transcriptional regulator
VTTAAPQREQDRKRAEAWSAYSESLRDLEGRDYEEAERTCWEQLQRALRRIEREDAAPPPAA